MRAIVALCVVALAAPASANGRDPGVKSIAFRRGAEHEIVAGATFGIVLSKDNGATWHWLCEDAVGYAGMYDPDIVVTRTGAIFATTEQGLMVSRNDCVYARSAIGEGFYPTIALGPDDALFAPTADPAGGVVAKSTDDGASFPLRATAGRANDAFTAIEVAPSDPQRVYASGERFVPDPSGGTMRALFALRSDDGGQTWTDLALAGVAAMPNSKLHVVGISATDPDVVYLRVEKEDNAIRDALYRSSDAGATWQRILGTVGSVSFIARRNGELVAATARGGFQVSTDHGASWQLTAVPPDGTSPHISCLVENAAGEVWACTQNTASMSVPFMDGYGIMKSTDLVTWTGVLRFEDVRGPLACTMDSVQTTKCAQPLIWCALCDQIGCEPAVTCPGAVDTTPPRDSGGCCQTSRGVTPALVALWLVIGMVLLGPRRRSP